MILLYTILASSCAMAAVGWLVGTLNGSGSAWRSEPIDLSDERTLGMLMGLSGGNVVDAVVAQSAVSRFEQTHGRRATLGDITVVAGMLKTMN